MTIKTYPEMNARIVSILRICGADPSLLYAAQRIEELEAEVERLRVWRELWNEIIDRNCWDDDSRCRFCGTLSSENHKEGCLFDRVDTMMAGEINAGGLARSAPSALSCGHPREEKADDRT